MSDIKLTTPSYLVLGMVELLEPVTPYQLKAFAAETVTKFWALPHTQIYTQCDRLLEAGYLSEKRESEGRRRRSFSITRTGAKALEAWRHEEVFAPVELRDLATLKLFFGADPKMLAEQQLAIHQAQLDKYLAVEKTGEGPEGARLALQTGIVHEREFVKFWKSQLKD
jgi:DNA-binding PadR family transcriptional regulator